MPRPGQKKAKIRYQLQQQQQQQQHAHSRPQSPSLSSTSVPDLESQPDAATLSVIMLPVSETTATGNDTAVEARPVPHSAGSASADAGTGSGTSGKRKRKSGAKPRASRGGGGGDWDQEGDADGGDGRVDDDDDNVRPGGCLPIAKLSDDWDGEVLDGATYLATVQRANAALPQYTRAPNPLAGPSGLSAQNGAGPSSSIGGEGLNGEDEHWDEGAGADVDVDVDSEDGVWIARPPASAPSAPSSRPRHPALPKEAWAVLFPLHFQAYRADIAKRWPPPPGSVPPYPASYPPLPAARARTQWEAFIHGRTPKPGKKTGAGKNKRRAAAALAAQAAEVEVEVDEEEMMNGPAVTPAAATPIEAEDGDGDGGEVDMDIDESEEEEGNVTPREPLVSVLQNLTTNQIIPIISLLTSLISSSLDTCEAALDLDGPSASATATATSATPLPCPLSELYARWIFALLLLVDPFLSADQTSVLRDLARVVMRVGGWRWVVAVTRGEVGSGGDATGTTTGTAAAATAAAPAWVLGARWKYARDVRHIRSRAELKQIKQTKVKSADSRDSRASPLPLPMADQTPPGARESWEEQGVDEVLARCWMVVYAVAGGWAQWDLVQDLESMFT